MASKKLTKESEEWKIFGDLFKFAQEFGVPEDEKWWDMVIEKIESEEYAGKYAEHTKEWNLLVRLCNAWMMYLSDCNMKNGGD